MDEDKNVFNGRLVLIKEIPTSTALKATAVIEKDSFDWREDVLSPSVGFWFVFCEVDVDDYAVGFFVDYFCQFFGQVFLNDT